MERLERERDVEQLRLLSIIGHVVMGINFFLNFLVPRGLFRMILFQNFIRVGHREIRRLKSLKMCRYRASLKRQMENSKYDFSLIPFVHRNTG